MKQRRKLYDPEILDQIAMSMEEPFYGRHTYLERATKEWLRDYDPYYKKRAKGKKRELEYPYLTENQSKYRSEREISLTCVWKMLFKKYPILYYLSDDLKEDPENPFK